MRLKIDVILKYGLMALTALSGLWLLNDHIFFSQTPLRSFYQHEIIIALALFVVFFGALIFYLIKSNDYKPNYAIMIGLLSVFIFLLVRLLVISPQTFNITAPGGGSYAFESHITSLERFKYCAQTFVTFALTFFFIDVFPKSVKQKEFKYILYLMLSIIYVLIICSYFVDFNSYINLITLKGGDINGSGIKSVFPHKTVFGFVVMTGGFIALLLFAKERKWYWLATVGIFAIHLLFTLSKLAIIVFFAVTLAYLIYVFVTTYKENPKKHKIILFSCLGALLLLIVIFVILLLASETVRQKVQEIITPSGYNTFVTRVWIWDYTFAILKQTSVFLGAGMFYFASVLKQANLMDPETAIVNNTSQTHNAYISMLANGGVPLLTLYVVLIVLVVVVLIKHFKRDLNISLFYALVLVGLLSYGFLEAAPIMLGVGGEHVLAGAFVVSGLLLHAKQNNEQPYNCDSN